MNVALIFAGGTGQRMNTKTTPKQFLSVHDKPIIIYALEQFENHEEIDGIVVVCLEEWIPRLKRLINRFQITKVCDIVPGGETGQLSIYHGLAAIHNRYEEDTVVLIHDGVRPLVDRRTIDNCLEGVRRYGSAITTAPATETIVRKTEGDCLGEILERSSCLMAKAPQCFLLKDIWEAHQKALADGITNFVDSASMMTHYGHSLHTVEGSVENLKITTPADFYIFRAILDARENSQIFGL